MEFIQIALIGIVVFVVIISIITTIIAMFSKKGKFKDIFFDLLCEILNPFNWL